MTDAAKLVVDISANSQKLTQDLAQSKSKVDAFAGSALKSISQIASAFAGAFVFKELAGVFESTLSHIEDLTAASEKFGTTLANFQKLEYLAKQAGVPVDTITIALKNLGKNIGFATAEQPLKEMADAFDRLGVSATTLKGLAPDKQFIAIATALGQISDANERDALASKILGKSWTDIAAIAATNIPQAAARFDTLKTALSETQKESIKTFTQVKADTETLFEGFKNNVAADFTPTITAVLKNINDTAVAYGGLKHDSLVTAQAMTEGAILISKGWHILGTEIELVIASLGVAYSLGSSVKQYISDHFHTPTGEFTSTYAGSKASKNGTAAADFQPLLTSIDTWKTIFQDKVSTNTQAVQSLTKEYDALQRQIDKTPAGNVNKAIDTINGETNNAAGYIKNEKTGEVIHVQLDPSKVNVQADITVKMSDGMMQVIDKRIETKINDVARGSGR
jgi:hypothetical protein